MVVVTVVIAHVWVPRCQVQVQIYSKTAGSSFRVTIPDSII